MKKRWVARPNMSIKIDIGPFGEFVVNSALEGEFRTERKIVLNSHLKQLIKRRETLIKELRADGLIK